MRCRGKISLVFLFGMILIKIIKYFNSVTDMRTVYRYTPLVKQAVSLRKLIIVLFKLFYIKYLQLCPSEVSQF